MLWVLPIRISRLPDVGRSDDPCGDGHPWPCASFWFCSRQPSGLVSILRIAGKWIFAAVVSAIRGRIFHFVEFPPSPAAHDDVG